MKQKRKYKVIYVKKMLYVSTIILLSIFLIANCSSKESKEKRLEEMSNSSEKVSDESSQIAFNSKSQEDQFTTLQEAVFFIFGVFTSIFIVFGVKKLSENTVNSFLILLSLKRSGKVAVGLRVKFLDWEGTITDIKAGQIKLNLHKSKNFVYINPKMIQDNAIEIMVNKDD